MEGGWKGKGKGMQGKGKGIMEGDKGGGKKDRRGGKGEGVVGERTLGILLTYLSRTNGLRVHEVEMFF